MRRRQKKKKNYFIIIIIMLVVFLLSLFLFSKIFNNNTSNSNLSEIEKDINGSETVKFKLNGGKVVSLYLGDTYVDEGVSAISSTDGDVSKYVEINGKVDTTKVGSYTLTYTLIYKGTTTTLERTVKVNESVKLTLIGKATVYLPKGSTYTDVGAKAVDKKDGDISDKIVVDNKVDINTPGEYEIKYSIKKDNQEVTVTRKIIVFNFDMTISASNNNSTNKDITLNVKVNSDKFGYLILPNGEKVNKTTYNYTVSQNGTYEFSAYSEYGIYLKKKFIVNNIDKESPTGTCSGTYGNGTSNIIIDARDNTGISKYVVNNNSYTTNNIIINKEMSSVNVIVYDKAGNFTNISCSLVKKELEKPTPSPTPNHSGTIKYMASTDTIKISVESISNYYVSHIWVKDAYSQLKTAVPDNFGNELLTPSNILNNTVKKHGWNNKVIIAVNGSGFVLKGTYDTAFYEANPSFNMTSVSPIVIVEGKVLRNISNGKIPSSNRVTYGLKKNGYLEYYNYVKGTNVAANINTSNKIINDGVQNTVAFTPVLVSGGKVVAYDTSPNIRQGFCQIDKNNFIFITNNDGSRENGFSFKGMAEYMVSLGCQTGFNLDGGGSTTLLVKNKGASPNTLVGNKRKVADILYFHE